MRARTTRAHGCTPPRRRDAVVAVRVDGVRGEPARFAGRKGAAQREEVVPDDAGIRPVAMQAVVDRPQNLCRIVPGAVGEEHDVHLSCVRGSDLAFEALLVRAGDALLGRGIDVDRILLQLGDGAVDHRRRAGRGRGGQCEDG
jgi:hypothetical protein